MNDTGTTEQDIESGTATGTATGTTSGSSGTPGSVLPLPSADPPVPAS